MNDTVASEPSRPTGNPGAGAMLLAERRRQGLSLGDISRQLKLSVRQVEALERDDYGMFRSPVFVHGFIRNYAKLLGMESAPLVAQADSVLTPVAPGKTQAVAPVAAANDTQERRSSFGMGKVAGGIAAVLLLGVFVYLSGGDPKGEAPPEPTSAFVPSEVGALQEKPEATAVSTALEPVIADQSTTGAEDASPANGAVIRMVFDQESWVEIKDGNGNTVFGQLMSAGSRRSVTGTPPLSVVIGNADGVRLSYQAKDIDLAPHTRVNVARLTLE